MKIHDALVLELIKPDKSGKPTGDIIKIIGTANIKYELEELVNSVRQIRPRKLFTVQYPSFEETIIEKMTPDIVVTKPSSPTTEEEVKIAIELETDVDFDFGKSLRQIKNYQRQFSDVRVIIPRNYEMFAPFYKNERFRVWLWKAIRLWQCLICGNITEKEGIIQPKCKDCGKYTKHSLIGIKDVKIEEFL